MANHIQSNSQTSSTEAPSKRSSSKESGFYDVVIVGAGMSGTLLALSLLKQNNLLNVLLLDENPKRVENESVNTSNIHSSNSVNPNPTKNPSFDARCIALNAGSVDILNGLGLWGDIKADGQAIEKIQVSDKGYFGAVDLIPDAKDAAFGYVVRIKTCWSRISESVVCLFIVNDFVQC